MEWQEYNSALICAQVWNARRTDKKQKIFEPSDFMRKRPPKARKRETDPLAIIRRMDAYTDALTASRPHLKPTT